MSQIAFIQARMSSQRLPGKVLAEVEGKALLVYLIERLRRCSRVRDIAVVTSTAPEDAAVAVCGERNGVKSYRGSLDDVLGRFLAAAEAFCVDSFVRINGDSPLLVPDLVDRGIEEFEAEKYDLVTNAFPRSYPKGQSVEVVSVEALKSVASQTSGLQDREHVTRFFYNHPDRFRVRNFANDADLSSIQMSVDTPDDLAAFKNLVSQMTKPHWNYGLDDLLVLRGSR